jgi:ubiquinone biosynthesis protein
VNELLSKKNAQEELMWVAKDVISSLRIIPKHFKWFLKEAARNNYSLELRIRDLDTLSRSISRSLFILGQSLLTCVCLLIGAIFIRNTQVTSLYDIPPLTWIFWGAASYLLIRMALLKKF